ncbi:peptidyl-tRNA hydrolase, putative (macronuclear) [Tetrahymena thermophila SB210]|uniref:Peptidyl-tRNA hydrolase, putative n=1 Tax=Tetrahymena thermophila (strain SB210) TaxID=312017 RepID=W7XE98_TETTS|nr:peptidyl-tRNA hydrolase, putative [Tetrahymena thermophila SB210]EWS72266.1 peptidyl-tRNA hydrolase, putative [Tetrahymena thermophila SB210]|eukprot:XP_012655206.1 peptidyl-tRNA hydrolase, putative [Tetrahymena thermophila SB210]
MTVPGWCRGKHSSRPAADLGSIPSLGIIIFQLTIYNFDFYVNNFFSKIKTL